ncbi:hypothetical protein P22_2034 [Propionispora sp. 2/2-37]|uniref:aspartate/glutamate racemase family protein n=1 Tax=Propionispora sp. 2/2-37 TaxID=1677858 RepID=UPI0006BB6695|nr:amino acid racemase [Propionispora sp. 2/2-37]CUH95946.1 hypothetical protein P22_2034 [Propionispora sp. 2/2-37]
MRTCGIVGGMGPDATALFYLKLVSKFRLQESYPPVLLYSVPEPFQLTDAWLKCKQGRPVLQDLVLEGIRRLGREVDFLVIPCNTAHTFFPKIRQASPVPVLSIVEETCKYIGDSMKWKRVGILASTEIIRSELYSNALFQRGIEVLLPGQGQQELLTNIIVRIVRGQRLSEDESAVCSIIRHLQARGAEGVVLACTDLPVLLSQCMDDLPLLDTLDVLAEAAKARILE